MDICRITKKEEFLAALATETRAEQAAILEAVALDRPAPGPAAAVLAVALPAVCIAVLPRGAYLWVAAVLLFELAYPVLHALPALLWRRPAGEHAYLRTLRELGLLEPGRKLGYLAGNAFVINARAVAPAFAWCSFVNLLVALAWLGGGPPARGLGLVIAVQSAGALGYCLAVWRLTPGVGRLRMRAVAVRDLLAAHRALGWSVLFLLSIPVAFAAVLLFWVLVLPGLPLLRVLAVGGVTPLVQTLEFAALFGGLYAVTRTVHSAESRQLARRVAAAAVRFIDTGLLPRLGGGGAPSVLDCEEYRVLATGLLEARVYRVERSAPGGRLPVYTVSPDLALVSDPETLAALRGHLDLEPDA